MGLIMSLLETWVSSLSTLIISLVLHTLSPIMVGYSVMMRGFTVRLFVSPLNVGTVEAFVVDTITCLPSFFQILDVHALGHGLLGLGPGGVVVPAGLGLVLLHALCLDQLVRHSHVRFTVYLDVLTVVLRVSFMLLSTGLSISAPVVLRSRFLPLNLSRSDVRNLNLLLKSYIYLGISVRMGLLEFLAV